MPRRFIPLLLMIALVLGTPDNMMLDARGSSTPAMTPAATPAMDCTAVRDYAIESAALEGEIDEDILQTIEEEGDWLALQPDQQRSLSKVLKEWVVDLEAMEDVPAGAQPYHEARINSLKLTISILDTAAAGDADATDEYTEPFNDALDEVTEQSRQIVDVCGFHPASP